MNEEIETVQVNGDNVEKQSSKETDEPAKLINKTEEKPKEKEKNKNDKTNGSPKSKVILFTSSGSMDKISVKDEVIPAVHKDEVLVKVKFAGVNFLDILKKFGVYSRTLSFPMVSGVEASGMVEAIGSDVTDFKAGDRVLVIQSEGLFREVVCVNHSNVIHIPDEMSFEDAASLFVNYVTAYDLLFKMGNLKSNQVVLLPQASGGVGNAVIQLAKTVPDVKIIALASKSKHEHLKSLGVEHLIDYKSQNYIEEVKRISPKGVDLALDSLNGEDSTHFFQLLKPFGRVIHYGVTNIAAERPMFKIFKGWLKCLSLTSLKIINTNKMMGGYNLNTLAEADPEIPMETLKILITLYKEGKIKPCVDSIFPFTTAKEAFLRLSKRQNVGKVLLSPTETEPKIFTEKPSSLAAE